MNLTPGFSMPQQNRPLTVSPGPLPPPQGADWSPWATPQGYPSPYPPPAQQYPPPPQPYPPNQYPPQPYQPPQREDSAVTNAFAALSVGSPAQQPPHTRTSSSGYSAGFPQAQYTVSPNISPPQATRTSSLPYPNYPTQPQLPPAASSKPPTPPQSSGGATSLTAPLPTIRALTAALPSIQQPTTDPSRKVTWAKDVLSLVDRAHHQTSAAAANAPNVDSTNVPIGPVRIGDQQLQRLVDIAVPLILQISNTPQVPPNPLPPYVVEAIYLRATCEASGAYPQIVPHNPRVAFRDFEQAAKAGYYQAWFRLGRDYEAFGDISHAKDCFERGVKYGVESCYYVSSFSFLI